MSYGKVLADGIFTCNKCGATRKVKIYANDRFQSSIILSQKMIHVCDKTKNKFGIMSITDITLGYDCDMDSILDNAYLTDIPVKNSSSSVVKTKLDDLSRQIGASDNEV